MTRGLGQSWRLHYAWVVVGLVSLAIFVASGLRGSFGVFLKPLEAEFGWDRAATSGIAAVSMLAYGAAQPLVGRLIDSWGPRRVLTGSLLLLGAGSLATAAGQALWQIYLSYGLVVSLASGGPAPVSTSAIAARWFQTHRGLVVGLGMSGMAAGQLVLIPATMGLIVAFGWRVGYAALAALVCLVVVPLVWLLVRDDPAEKRLAPFGTSRQQQDGAASGPLAGLSVVAATRRSAFWLLTASFFMCGYSTTGLVSTHLVPHAIEHGVPELAAASALGLMGAVNVLGAIVAGYVCDRYGRRVPLALTYVLRGVSLLWLMLVRDAAALHLFAVLFGVTFIATVPPTAALIADQFGRRSAAEIFGWIFVAHQIGSALGAGLGGWLYQLAGDYQAAFFSGAVACFLAAGLVLALRHPVRRPAAAPAPS
ncbi:MAG: MFS transporter [Chloroflexi bacterium]|nr:MFS transporter [Chloroflexota bacterium]